MSSSAHRRPVRVVHVTGGTRTGCTRVVLNLLKHQDRTKFAPAVCFFSITPAEAAVLAEVAALEVSWRDVVKRSRYELGAIGRLAAALRELEAEVVVLHGFGAYSFGVWAARLARATAVIRVEHSPELHSRFHAVASACTAPFVDSVVLVSRYLGGYLRSHGTRLARSEVIYNGIDLDAFAAVRRPPLANDGPAVVLMTARLDTAKDQATLIDAMAILARQGRQARLQLAGDGPRREALEAQARNAGVALEMLGYRSDLATLLEDADIFVLATHFEGFGLAVVEAMAAGRPVIATDTASLPEIVENGTTGLLVPPKDASALATALTTMLDDRARARRMGEAGRGAAQRFSMSAATNAFDAHLERVWARASTPSSRTTSVARVVV